MDLRDFGIDPADERAQTIADARSSIGRPPEERIALFLELLRLIQQSWDSQGLSEEERRQRIVRTRALDPRPDPWWRDIRPEALE